MKYFDDFIETFKLILLQIKDVFAGINWIPDILDILLVAFLLYALIKQLRKSQSIQVIKGILFVAVIFGIVKLAGMQTSSFIFTKLFSDIMIIFVVLFSTELRQALQNIGKKKFAKNSFFSGSSDESQTEAINAVCRSCGAMSRSKVGSLIIFQRESLLGDLTKYAVPIDSETTYEMICSIFYPKAPLHDGAVVIKDGRIVAARCVIPMKNDRDIIDNIGTRHRAALEVSFSSDAVVVVTSEETGIISLAVDGKLIRGLTDSQLREKLSLYLLGNKNSKKKNKNSKSKNKQKSKSEKSEIISDENITDTEADKLSEDLEASKDDIDVTIEAPFAEDTDSNLNTIVNEGGNNCEQE